MKHKKFLVAMTAVFMMSTLFVLSSRATTPLVKLGLLVDRKGDQVEVKTITFGALKELDGIVGLSAVKIPFYAIDYIEFQGYNPSVMMVESTVHFRDGSSVRLRLHNEIFHGKSTLGTFTIQARDVSELHFPD